MVEGISLLIYKEICRKAHLTNRDGKCGRLSLINSEERLVERRIVMATASITKSFTINDDQVCQRLIDEMNNPNRKRKEISHPNAYEEGKRLLKLYLSR